MAQIMGFIGFKKYLLSIVFEINSQITSKLNTSFYFLLKLFVIIKGSHWLFNEGLKQKHNTPPTTIQSHFTPLFSLLPSLSLFFCSLSFALPKILNISALSALLNWLKFPLILYHSPHPLFLFHLPLPFFLQNKQKYTPSINKNMIPSSSY